MARLWTTVLVAAAASISNAAITVYRVGDHGAYATTTTSAASSSFTGTAAYDPTVLTPPAPPTQLNRDFVVLVCLRPALIYSTLTRPIRQLNQGEPQGASIPIPGSYLGFSIELSVANRVIGRNSSVLSVPFLNHIVNVANRAGTVRIRVGGNSKFALL
jgi:hypothetical protein